MIPGQHDRIGRPGPQFLGARAETPRKMSVLAGYMGDVDVDRSLALLAETQHGVVTRRQALELGLSARAIHGRLEGGRWERTFRGVFRITGTDHTYEQLIRAATLAAGPGAVASHRSAAGLREVPGLARWVEVTVPAPRQVAVPGVAVHQASFLAPADCDCLGLIPLTSPARTVIDLSAELSKERLGRLLDHFLRHRLVTRIALEQRLAELGSKGRKGTRLLQELLDARPTSPRPMDGAFEPLLFRLLTGSG